MGDIHLWIGDAKIGHDLIARRAPIYSSRPPIPAIPGAHDGFRYLPLLGLGDPWRRQRKFVHIVLSTAQNQRFHGYVASEVRLFLWNLIQRPDEYYSLVEEYTARTSNRLAYGTPRRYQSFIDNVQAFIPQIGPNGPPANLMPFLNHLPEKLNPGARGVRERMEKEWIMFQDAFAEVERDLKQGKDVPPCYVTTFHHVERRDSQPARETNNSVGSNPVSKNGKGFGFASDEIELRYAIGMLCNVAIMTIAGPIQTFFLTIVLYPEWQAELQAEVDSVLGDRLVTFSDSPSLPKLRAFIKECFRWKPPIPLGTPRLCTEDNEYNGHFIAKGTHIHVLELALTRDERLYPDPEAFNPNRRLDPAFPTYKEPLSEHPKLDGHSQFGDGWHKCPGISLTEALMLHACSGIVGGFNCRPKKRADGSLVPIDSVTRKVTVIGGVLASEFDITPRSVEKAQLIEREWMEAQHEHEDLLEPTKLYFRN